MDSKQPLFSLPSPGQMCSFIRKTLFFLCAAAWIFLFFRFIFPATLPLWLGLCVAFLLRPAILWLSQKLHLRRRRAALFVTVFFYAGIGCLIWLAVSLLWGQLCALAAEFPNLYKQIFLPALADFFEWLSAFLSRFVPNLSRTVELWMRSFGSAAAKLSASISSWLFSCCTGIASRLPLWFLSITVTVFCSAFLSLDYPQTVHFLKKLIPSRFFPLLARLKQFASLTLLRMTKAYLFLLLITFSELCLGLWILKVPRFILIAALIALLDLLPILGTGTVLIPWSIFCFLSQNTRLGIGLLLMYLIITVARNFLEPKIIGDSIGLPPLLSLLSVYAGFRLFGVIGAFLAPPLALLLFFFSSD